MSTAYVPHQPQPGPPAGPPPALPPTPPYASEATRLLCAGTYLDSAYRDRVIEELHLNEQRIAAPSLGFDAARVLAHALRARRQELLWAGAILGLWVVGLPLSGGLLVFFLVPGIALAVAPWIRGRAARPPLYRVIAALMVRWWGRSFYAVALIATLVVAFGGGSDNGPSYDSYGSYDGSYGYSYSDSTSFGDLLAPGVGDFGGLGEAWHAWFTLAVFAGVALCAHAQRTQFSRALAGELSPQRFPDAASDPAEKAENPASSGSSSASGSNSTHR